MADQEGYDATFISHVPDYLRCVVCQFVLRKPIQIMKCGHRMCQSCFERSRERSIHMKTLQCCPADGGSIDEYKVFDDTVMHRVVSNLVVKCGRHRDGCDWNGSLIDLKDHEDGCQYGKTADDKTHTLLHEFFKRMDQYEIKMKEQEDEIVRMRGNIEELQLSAKIKDDEVRILNEKNTKIENEMELFRRENKEAKETMRNEINVLNIKNQSLENENSLLSCQLHEMKDTINDKIKLMDDLEESVITTKSNAALSWKMVDEEIKLLHNKVENVYQLLINESAVESIHDMRKEVEKSMNDIRELSSHVESVENIIFCDQLQHRGSVAKLKWILNNYEYRANIGEEVMSPLFYTHVWGYSFQLCASWSGVGRESLDICLLIRRTREKENEFNPFEWQYTFEIPDGKGERHCFTVPHSREESVHNDSIICPRENDDKEYVSRVKTVLNIPSHQKWIINDMLTIYCVVD